MSRVQTELHGNAVLMRGEKQHRGQASLGCYYMLVIELGRAERHYWRDLWRLLARSLCESANQTTSREVIC
jgi:hypothetical protein